MEKVVELKISPYDSARYLESDEAIEAYLVDALDTGDPAFIASALGTIARAKNMTKLAAEVGMSRSALYRALSGEGNPEFRTIAKVMKALGLRMIPASARINDTARC